MLMLRFVWNNGPSLICVGTGCSSTGGYIFHVKFAVITGKVVGRAFETTLGTRSKFQAELVC